MGSAICRSIHFSKPSTGISYTRNKSHRLSSHRSIPIMPITSIRNSLVKHPLVRWLSCWSVPLHRSSLDSPGIPPSADAHDSFQGFSYIAPDLINSRQNDPAYANDVDRRLRSIVGVKLTSFKDEYDLKEPLGHGKTSTCHRCVHRQTRAEYAVKIIKDVSLNDPADEIELLFHYNQLTHVIRVWTRPGEIMYGITACFILIFRYVMHSTMPRPCTSSQSWCEVANSSTRSARRNHCQNGKVRKSCMWSSKPSNSCTAIRLVKKRRLFEIVPARCLFI